MKKSGISLPTLQNFTAVLTKKSHCRKIYSQIGKLGKFFNAQRKKIVNLIYKEVFDYKTVRRILGTNIVLLIISTSVVQDKSMVFAINKINFAQAKIESPILINTQKGIRYPVDVVRQTQGFNIFHPGLDLDGITGDPIYPVMNGVVQFIEYSKFGYGNSIIIDHKNGYSSRYAYLSKINVKIGETVTIKTKIGEMGATRRSFGDHLHLCILKFMKIMKTKHQLIQ